MVRREKIWHYIKTQLDTKNQTGVTTSEVAQALGLERSNVSKELNELVRLHKLVKQGSRPVYYCLAATSDQPYRPMLTESKRYTVGFAGAAKLETHPPVVNQEDPFDNMVGSHASLRNQVEQAKAALLYPPYGLNTLVIGPTGSGKTYFANTMFQFAQRHQIVTQTKLVTFNCADYAHNPQLLMSHLFGYVQGSFTGAKEDTPGLIQQADGGILFLDEVHRLPPEGQEMIFYFMDHGTYSRLGETEKQHHANVRIICATTENPESALLQTFVRRIPILIQLPPFQQRSAQEKLQLVEQLLTLEANRIHKHIQLTEDVVQALVGSVTYGNVGQLKSNIQLVCAQGFLTSLQDATLMQLRFDQLPPNLKEGLSHLANDRQALGDLTRLMTPTLLIKPDAGKVTLTEADHYELPYNLYEIIGDKVALLKEEGLDQSAINHFIMTDINLHLKSFYHHGQYDQPENRLTEIVAPEIIELTRSIQHSLQTEHYLVRDNFLYAMSLHIGSFIKRIQSGKPLRNMSADLISMAHDYPHELMLANQVKELIEAHYRFPIPESEIYYLTILLASLHSEDQQTGQVGLIVAAHGKSTATSMAQVVTQLLSVKNLTAFDMPLEMSPKQALAGVADLVPTVDHGSGVLLLVDMGSLSTFAPKLTELTGVEVKVVDMVTTAMVLEAARKTALIDSDLETVYHELKEFDGYSRSLVPHQEPPKKAQQLVAADERPKAIVAVCSTGEGTAKKIKGLLDQLLADHLVEDTEVLPISLVKLDEHLQQLNQQYHIIATTGVVKPDISVPYVSLEDLLQGGGEAFIKLLDQLDNQETLALAQVNADDNLSDELTQHYLSDYFTFINPAKVTKVLVSYCEFVARRCQLTFTNAFKISLIMHLAGAIERVLTQSQMQVDAQVLSQLKRDPLLGIVVQANDILRETLNISLSAAESYYLWQLIDTERQKQTIH